MHADVRPRKALNRYAAIIAKVFARPHESGVEAFEFTRQELEEVAQELAIKLPKNIGDLIYSFRYRTELPGSIVETASNGLEWIIEGAGRAKYRFRLVRLNRIVPRDELLTIKVPDATPAIGSNMWSRCRPRVALTNMESFKPNRTLLSAARSFLD